MKYLTGIHALNLPCSLDTPGDWHGAALNWENLDIRESDASVFNDYGIELNRRVPGRESSPPVANHIRACLDLIESGSFGVAEGMNQNFIGNDRYTEEIFEKVCLLRERENWLEIYKFMHKEYGRAWRVWASHKSQVPADALPPESCGLHAQSDTPQAASHVPQTLAGATPQPESDRPQSGIGTLQAQLARIPAGLGTVPADDLIIKKATAFILDKKAGDLYDVVYIFNNRELSDSAKRILAEFMEHTIEYFDMVVNPVDEPIDVDAVMLAEGYISMLDSLGVLVSAEERQEIRLSARDAEQILFDF